jgi:transcriptional regulator
MAPTRLAETSPERRRIAADETLKKGTAELLVLAQLEDRSSHGYEIAQQIDRRSNGAVSFHAASLYPVLYRLERRGLIAGRWVEKAGQRRRRYYSLTAGGRKVLAERRRNWSAFMQAVQAAAGLGYA